MIRAIDIFAGSDGKATQAYYEALGKHGLIGAVALNLMRAEKNSTRAKAYRGGNERGSFRRQAYDRKNWAMGMLVDVLMMYETKNRDNSDAQPINWGWKHDPSQEHHDWVLYVDVPHGQVSFHTSERGRGPDYSKDWDGQHRSQERVLAFCDAVMRGTYS